MTEALPRTIRAVDTDQLLHLEEEAPRMGLSQRLPIDWLREDVAGAATHYLFPLLVHQLSHRPEVSPQWRCQVLLTIRTGETISQSDIGRLVGFPGGYPWTHVGRGRGVRNLAQQAADAVCPMVAASAELTAGQLGGNLPRNPRTEIVAATTPPTKHTTANRRARHIKPYPSGTR